MPACKNVELPGIMPHAAGIDQPQQSQQYLWQPQGLLKLHCQLCLLSWEPGAGVMLISLLQNRSFSIDVIVLAAIRLVMLQALFQTVLASMKTVHLLATCKVSSVTCLLVQAKGKTTY